MARQVIGSSRETSNSRVASARLASAAQAKATAAPGTASASRRRTISPTICGRVAPIAAPDVERHQERALWVKVEVPVTVSVSGSGSSVVHGLASRCASCGTAAATITIGVLLPE